MLHPAESITSVTQAARVIAIAMAVAEIARMAKHRAISGWGISKALTLLLGGTLLVAFPGSLLGAVTSLAAALLAAAGLIEAFAPAPPGGAPGVRTGFLAIDSLTARIARRPDAGEDLASLQEKVFFEGTPSATRYLRFVTLMALASTLAALSVVVESTAVVIGAMLVAPLMTPLMGTALSAVMGWPRRMRRCVGVALSGVAIAITTGALVGAIVPRTIDVTTNPEILSRVSPTIVDLGIALAAGADGAYALSRKDVSDALPGVAVAISLVPPLTVVGLNWEQGALLQGNGALLLFLTNAAAILLAGGATFVLVGIAPLARVERVLSTWTAAHERFGVVDDRTLGDGTIVIDLAGPGTPPELDSLMGRLTSAAGHGVEVRIRWVDQQEASASG